MREPRKYLLQCVEDQCGQTRCGLIAERSVNLLRGPDVVCSRWLLQALIDYANGEPVLGHKSNPMPIAYWLADHRVEEIRQTLEELGMKVEPFHLLSDRGAETSIGEIIRRTPPETGLLIVEDLANYAAGVRKNYGSMAKWLFELRRVCEFRNLTFIGTTARNGLFGSHGWDMESWDTKITITPSKTNDAGMGSYELLVYRENHRPVQFKFRPDLWLPAVSN